MLLYIHRHLTHDLDHVEVAGCIVVHNDHKALFKGSGELLA